jgi:hypothetical protein
VRPGTYVVVDVAVVVDQPELQPPLTFVGASMVRQDMSSHAEQPQPDPIVGKLVAATPRNSEDLSCDVVGIGG